MDTLHFVQLTVPTPAIAETFTRWENDPVLVPFARPNRSKEDLERREEVTVADLTKRLEHNQIYLIYAEDLLVGEMNYQVDPAYLFKKEPGTAWIGITIGEAASRGKGIGFHALSYLEQQITLNGLKRIELGVFEFNAQAIKLYQKCGYREIGRIEEFTYWNDRLWQDIRMEKYIIG